MTNVFVKKLTDKSTYKKQIIRLQERLAKNSAEYRAEQENIPFYNIYFDADNISTLLAETIKAEEYRTKPRPITTIKQEEKYRLISAPKLLDRIVQSAISTALLEQKTEKFSENVYSYIPGRSSKKAILDCAKFIRQSLSSANKQNLYLFRTDIKNYTDSIPLGPKSPVWSLLDNHLNKLDPDETLPAYYRNLVHDAAQPTYHTMEEKALFQNLTGLPMGSPLTNFIAILYLQKLDDALASIPGVFYARYGDDIILLSKEAKIILTLYEKAKAILSELKLTMNTEKTGLFYLTFAARPCNNKNFQGCSQFDYLGASITAKGTVKLKTKHFRNLLISIKHRMNNNLSLLKDSPLEDRGKSTAEMLSTLFNKKNFLSDKKLIQHTLLCSDRSQLKQLDYFIALHLAERLTGIRGVKAFRKISYKKMRAEWKLPSLCQLKNKKFMGFE